MIAAETLGRPWSFTLHRGDIKANNLLRRKASSAQFVRCISNQGNNWTRSLIGDDLAHKLVTIHLGVELPKSRKPTSHKRDERPIVIVVPARLVPVKGHTVLLQALELLHSSTHVSIQCLFIGDGPERLRLEREVGRRGLQRVVQFLGRKTREELLTLYETGEVDLVVLPSITTDDGEFEGVPVSLMEAMAFKIPVISTRSGAVAELIDGSGLIVAPGNSSELAAAIETISSDAHLAQRLSLAGWQKIRSQFNASMTASRLISLINLA